MTANTPADVILKDAMAGDQVARHALADLVGDKDPRLAEAAGFLRLPVGPVGSTPPNAGAYSNAPLPLVKYRAPGSDTFVLWFHFRNRFWFSADAGQADAVAAWADTLPAQQARYVRSLVGR